MDVHLIITFTTKPELRQAFARLVAQVRTQLPQVPGCKSVRTFNSASDSCVFTLLETWVSEDLHKAHIERVVGSGAWKHIASHLACEPTSSYYTET